MLWPRHRHCRGPLAQTHTDSALQYFPLRGQALASATATQRHLSSQILSSQEELFIVSLHVSTERITVFPRFCRTDNYHSIYVPRAPALQG